MVDDGKCGLDWDAGFARPAVHSLCREDELQGAPPGRCQCCSPTRLRAHRSPGTEANCHQRPGHDSSDGTAGHELAERIVPAALCVCLRGSDDGFHPGMMRLVTVSSEEEEEGDVSDDGDEAEDDAPDV